MCNLYWCYTFCTDVTLFALVLHLNCTALSQSESSNFFKYIIRQKTLSVYFYYIPSENFAEIEISLTAKSLPRHIYLNHKCRSSWNAIIGGKSPSVNIFERQIPQLLNVINCEKARSLSRELYRRIWLTRLHPWRRSIQIMRWFIWEITVVLFMHIPTRDLKWVANGCKHVSRITRVLQKLTELICYLS